MRVRRLMFVCVHSCKILMCVRARGVRAYAYEYIHACAHVRVRVYFACMYDTCLCVCVYECVCVQECVYACMCRTCAQARKSAIHTDTHAQTRPGLHQNQNSFTVKITGSFPKESAPACCTATCAHAHICTTRTDIRHA